MPAPVGRSFHHLAECAPCGFRLESGAEFLNAFAVTPNATRHFCRRCGSHVYSTDLREPGIVGLPQGIVAGDDLPAPKVHYYFDSGVSWCDVAASARKAGGATGREPLDV